MQQALSSVKPPNGVTPGTNARSLESAIAAHPIEPELQTASPRLVIFRQRLISTGNIYTAATIGVLVLFLLGVFIPILVMHVSVIFVMGCLSLIHLYLSQQKHKKLLTNGLPKAAMLINIEEDIFSRRTILTFTFESPQGAYEHYKWSSKSSPFGLPDDLKTGKTFTLLVDPQNPADILPYFAVNTCDIVGAQRITHGEKVPPVRLRHGVSAEPGVEPELYSAAPRRVRWTRGTVVMRLIGVNLYVGIAMLVVYMIKHAPDNLLYPCGPFLFFATLLLIGWIIREHRLWTYRFFLQYGYAVRATVIDSKRDVPTNNLSIRIEYPKNETEMAHEYVTLPVFRTQYLGGSMTAGTTYTILRHPSEAYTTIPYFDIAGVEIPGAERIQVTPPRVTKA